MPNTPTKKDITQFTQELTQVVSSEKLVELKDQPTKQQQEPGKTPADMILETDTKAEESIEKTPDILAKEKTVKTQDPNMYRVMFYMKHFRVHDIVIKVVGQTLVIDAAHKEYVDEHGFATRSMVRKQNLPEDVIKEKLVSWFSADGVLIIQAPRVEKN
ncbi:hypothetical protein JTE90_020959 [Oedothorax gibbosus]|uniref:SHSP domain-containing protein n=1 Tax=Oedothorax gibbosus TaxID=931172 RepID=A0AAV6U7I1_9ARAC|nr:hypothetical protein JTE90_020959 [Oedothorax gibbosus]